MIKKFQQWIWKHFKNYFITLFLFVISLWLFVSAKVTIRKISCEELIETMKISSTVLISMLGYSVSIYVFLNNTLQTRRHKNEIEREIIDLFQDRKKKDLSIRIVFSVVSIIVELTFILFRDSFGELLKDKNYFIYLALWICIIIITILNVCLLGKFTYNVINYEQGLKDLAKKKILDYKENENYGKMTKGEFLNLVNNCEVLVERLTINHLHAKTSSAYDSDLKRAICDGITDIGEISTRKNFSKEYKEIIEYRNLILQYDSLADSDEIKMGDQIKSVMNRLFQNYLKGELLTGVNLSNFDVDNSDLEKTSFANSALQNISFVGNTHLQDADFRDSTINKVRFLGDYYENINFSNCKLIEVEFRVGVKLHHAVFQNADLTGMKCIGPEDKEGDRLEFDHANFVYANLTYQDIFNSKFDFCDFTNARLVDCKIGASAQKKQNVTFVYANMEKADMLRCIIERCIFQNAVLKNANFTYANISDVDFSEGRLYSANFTESVIKECQFEKAYCSEISLKGAKLKDCKFEYAIMSSADLSGASLENVSFMDAVCYDSLWIKTQVENSCFQRCVLSNARIVGQNDEKTRIVGCDFKYANLSNIAITNIEFCRCDFKCADFTSARLINVTFTDCKNLETTSTKELWMAGVYFGGKNKSIFNLADIKQSRYKENVVY